MKELYLARLEAVVSIEADSLDEAHTLAGIRAMWSDDPIVLDVCEVWKPADLPATAQEPS